MLTISCYAQLQIRKKFCLHICLHFHFPGIQKSDFSPGEYIFESPQKPFTWPQNKLYGPNDTLPSPALKFSHSPVFAQIRISPNAIPPKTRFSARPAGNSKSQKASRLFPKSLTPPFSAPRFPPKQVCKKSGAENPGPRP
jgi:hypothetical protein